MNARIASVADWRWRGVVGDAFCDRDEDGLESEELEAAWTDATTGASGDQAQSAKDERLTREILRGVA